MGITIKKRNILILQDCEPDDVLAMIYRNFWSPISWPFFVLTVSPSAKKHTEDTNKLFRILESQEIERRKNLMFHTDDVFRQVQVYEGASYGRSGFEEPEDQSYVEALKKFFAEAEDGSVEVHLLTTCYALMKHWQDDWLPKIRVVYHMGGEGVGGNGKVGFNWRVGKEWVKPLLEKIPYGKLYLLEPNFYNPLFQKTFNGKVSICPSTFPKFHETIATGLKVKNELISFVVDHNYAWVHAMLKDWPDGRQFYPENGKEHLYFGPADICLEHLCDNINVHHKTDEVPPTCIARKMEWEGEEYPYISFAQLDFESMETHLIHLFFRFARELYSIFGK